MDYTHFSSGFIENPSYKRFLNYVNKPLYIKLPPIIRSSFMKKITVFAYMVLSVCGLFAQAIDSAKTGGEFTVNGYVDAYYGFDFNEPAGGEY